MTDASSCGCNPPPWCCCGCCPPPLDPCKDCNQCPAVEAPDWATGPTGPAGQGTQGNTGPDGNPGNNFEWVEYTFNYIEGEANHYEVTVPENALTAFVTLVGGGAGGVFLVVPRSGAGAGTVVQGTIPVRGDSSAKIVIDLGAGGNGVVAAQPTTAVYGVYRLTASPGVNDSATGGDALLGNVGAAATTFPVQASSINPVAIAGGAHEGGNVLFSPGGPNNLPNQEGGGASAYGAGGPGLDGPAGDGESPGGGGGAANPLNVATRGGNGFARVFIQILGLL